MAGQRFIKNKDEDERREVLITIGPMDMGGVHGRIMGEHLTHDIRG